MTEVQDDDRIKALKKNIADINREKQQIVSVVSHDLKSPLNRVFALVQLLNLDDSNLTTEQKQYLSMIHQVVADGLSMIRNLVDYRNLEFRSIDIRPEEIDIADFMKTTVRNFIPLAEKKNIKIKLHAPDEVLINTDNQCLGRIADGLLSNAIKFSAGGKEIIVEVKDAGDAVEVSVKDEARGFTQEDKLLLFNKFIKLKTKPTAGESSTGLGLFIVKNILDRIGGTIQCDTVEGIGSTFTFRLPKKAAGF